MRSHAFTTYALFAVLTVAAILIALVGTEQALDAHDLSVHRGAVERVVERHRTRIARQIATTVPEVRYLSEREDVARLLETGEGWARITDDLALLADATDQFHQIRILDVRGHEVARVNHENDRSTIVPIDALQSKSDRYYVERGLALEADEVYVSPLDLNVEHGVVETPPRWVVRVVAPVVDGESVLGLVVANLPAAPLLRELDEEEEAPVALVDGEGRQLAGPTVDPALWQLVSERASGTASHAGAPASWRRIDLQSEIRSVVDGVQLYVVSAAPASEVCSERRQRRTRLAFIGLASLLALTVLSIGRCRAERARIRSAADLERSEAQMRRLSGLLLDGQEQERKALSRWLHDDLGQRVTTLSLRTQLAPGIPTSDQGLLREAIGQLLESVRAKARDLRSTVLDDLGLVEALEELVASYAEGPFQIELDAQLAAEPSRAVADAVYRIAQEAITNAIRHSRGDRVRVHVESREGQVWLSIEDNGTGFDPHQVEPGLGLLGMEERCSNLGGTFQVETTPGGGTRIRIALPDPAR